MMAIGEPRRSLDFSQKMKPNKKRTTPFSIDDILSNSKKLKTNSISLTKNDEVLKNKREDFSEKTFFPGLYLNSITEKSEEYYSKWIAEFYKLYSTKLLQPFWFSPLNTEAYHNRLNSQPSFLPLNLNIEPFHTSESNPCHRSPNNYKRLKHHSVRQSSFSPASTNKKEENQSKERSASRDEHSACSSCNRDSVKSTVDIEMIKQDSSTSDSPLSALEKLTCVTFKELEHSKKLIYKTIRFFIFYMLSKTVSKAIFLSTFYSGLWYPTIIGICVSKNF